MNEFLKQNKSYIIIVLLFLFIVVGSTYSIRYFIRKIDETFVKTQELMADQESSIDMLTELPKIRDQYREIEGQIPVLNEFFKQNEIVSLVQMLERIAAETGNDISIEVDESKQVRASKKAEGVGEKLIVFPEDQIVKIGVNLVGRYDSVVKFLQKIKGIKYYGDVSAIEMNVRKPDTSTQRVRQSTVFAKNEEEEGQQEEETAEKIPEVLIGADLEMVFYLENKKEAEKK